MNNQQNKTNRTKKPYPLFTYFCLLLAVATMCTGVTFARYATSSQVGAGVGVVPLACSFSIDEISSTAFSNSSYWVKIDNHQYEQNHPREIVFSVHNYKKNADGTKSAPSEIDLQSTFRFFAPKELLENVAFQILKKGEGSTRIPLTQQYVLPQIISKAASGAKNMRTSEFTMKVGEEIVTPADYGEYAGCPEETLTFTNHSFNSTEGSGKFVAIAQTADNTQVATIALSAEKHQNVKYEITQARGNEKTLVDGNETKVVNDMSAPEYYGTYQADEMVYYCLDVTLPSMTLKATPNTDGTFQTIDNQFIFAFTIIDTHSFDANGKQIEEHFNVRGISLYNDAERTSVFSQDATVKVVNSLDTNGNITLSKYFLVEGLTETEFTLDGNSVKLKDNQNTTYYISASAATNLNDHKWDPETNMDTYKIANAVRKVYSTDMRVLFTQASQVGGN